MNYSGYNKNGERLLSLAPNHLFKDDVSVSAKEELASHFSKVAKLAVENDSDIVQTQRKCPKCGGDVHSWGESFDIKYDGRRILPDVNDQISMANDRLVNYISYLSDYLLLFPDSENPNDFFIMHDSTVSYAFRNFYVAMELTSNCLCCYECDHEWNLFEEFDSILATENPVFIRKALTSLNIEILCDEFYSLKSLFEPMKTVINLVKARCYYKMSLQLDRSSNDYTKFLKLANDFFSEYEKCPQEFRNTTLLSTYEAELRNEMSDSDNNTNSNTGIDSVISLSEFTEAEQKYIEAYYSIIIDGNESESDQRMLERLRSSLAISKMDAAELEAIIRTRLHENQVPELSDNEKEYLEAVKDYLADGEINERRRRMLDSYRDSLGISQQRTTEIESMVK